MASNYKQQNLCMKEIKFKKSTNRTSTFVDNMKLAIHRRSRYSAEWAKEIVKEYREDRSIILFDPSVGLGTNVLAGEECGV